MSAKVSQTARVLGVKRAKYARPEVGLEVRNPVPPSQIRGMRGAIGVTDDSRYGARLTDRQPFQT